MLLIFAFSMITNGLSGGENVVLNGIDLSNVSDGSYMGTYKYGRWTNTLTIYVESNKITRIEIDEDVLASGITNCSNEVFRRVIKKQSTEIDAVSGATVTTKAYLMAIEDALKQ